MGMDWEFHKQLCAVILLFFAVWTPWRKCLSIILVTSLGDSWGRLATYQQMQMKSIQPLVVAFALQLGVPFRASRSNSTIGCKYRVLPHQPLSRLGELFQGLDRVVSFPMQEETLVGKGEAKGKSDNEVAFKDVWIEGWISKETGAALVGSITR